jgi:hypothetical protein
MRNSLPTRLSYEEKLEHIIEQIVLNVIAPDNESADDFRLIVREFCKVVLRLNKLEPASDALVDEIVGEMIEWHAPRPDEEGYDAAATPEQCLLAANRRRDEAAWAERQFEYAAKREETGREDRFKRVREDAERRRLRGDHEGADFLEQWVERQTAKGPVP